MSIWQSLERQRGLRSFWINTRDKSSASNIVWTPLSLPTVPGQHTTNPRPFYSLSVKLLKSLTVANDVFVFRTYYWRFQKGCFLPHRWVLGGLVAMLGHWQETGEVTGCPRGPKKGGWMQGSSAVLPSYFFKSSFGCRVEGRKRERGQLKHPNTILKTMFLSIIFYAKYVFPPKITKSNGKINK